MNPQTLPTPDQAPEPTPVREISRKPGFWKKIGGGALSIAIIFHLVILLIGALWVIKVYYPPAKNIDFLPGNGKPGGGERSASHSIQQKKRAQITPTANSKRVFAEGVTSNFALPDPGDSFGEMSTLSSLSGGGGLGGLGGSGGGKGFGNGIGGGAGNGGLKPIMMFGMLMKDTQKIAVVMDVSRSMTKYLPVVANELDKLSTRGPLILYFGCGLSEPTKKEKLDNTVRLANGPSFQRFWQLWQGKTPTNLKPEERKLLKYDPNEAMPLPAIYEQMSRRLDTYFIDFNGIRFSQPALLARELKGADTIYWFSDFMDNVDDEVIKDVLRTLKSRKQKLFMHATTEGNSFEKVRDQLALPSGGGVTVKDVK
jgi:hypothetical protein